jgi:hypothetical protein
VALFEEIMASRVSAESTVPAGTKSRLSSVWTGWRRVRVDMEDSFLQVSDDTFFTVKRA